MVRVEQPALTLCGGCRRDLVISALQRLVTRQAAGADAVERAVLDHATDGAPSTRNQEAAGTSSSGAGAADAGGFDMVAASEWPGVAAEAALLSPAQCRALWRQFASDSAHAVQQVLVGPSAPPADSRVPSSSLGSSRTTLQSPLRSPGTAESLGWLFFKPLLLLMHDTHACQNAPAQEWGTLVSR